MAETTGDDAAQGAAEEQAQGATAVSDEQAQGAAAEGGDTVEALRERITSLERDNYAYREDKRKREEAEKSTKDKSKSEVEKLTTRLSEMEQSLAERDRKAKEQSLRLAAVTEAGRLGFRNADVAYRLLDAGSIEYDEAGDPTNVAAMLGDLAKSEPYLLNSTDFGGGPRGKSAATNDDMNARIRRAVGTR